MSEAKNTWRHLPMHAGPWAWSGDQLLAERDMHSETILVVHDDVWAPNDADKAVIAAAPDLLAAAKAHIAARDALAGTPTHRLNSDDARFAAVTDTLDALKAAIAKAEGH